MTSLPGTNERRVCQFEIEGLTFGLRLESVSEIVPMAALSRPPSMPSILEGFLNLRGTAVPVVRTAVLLGLSQQGLELHTPLVVVRGNDSPLALLVQRVTGIVPVPSSTVAPLGESDSFNRCVESSLMTDGRMVHLLSVDRLLLEKEQQIVAEFQTTEANRLRQLEPRLS